MRVEHCIACGGKEVVNVELNAGKVVKCVQEEVRVFIITEHQQVDNHDYNHQKFLFPLDLGFLDPLADEEVRQYAENQDANVTTACLVVKEQACSEEERIAQQKLAMDKREYGEYDREESPEVELYRYL